MLHIHHNLLQGQFALASSCPCTYKCCVFDGCEVPSLVESIKAIAYCCTYMAGQDTSSLCALVIIPFVRAAEHLTLLLPSWQMCLVLHAMPLLLLFLRLACFLDRPPKLHLQLALQQHQQHLQQLGLQV